MGPAFEREKHGQRDPAVAMADRLLFTEGSVKSWLRATLWPVPVLAIGVSHHQASVDALTQFTACAQRVAPALREQNGVHGLIVLSTCNRCELYLDADSFHDTVHAARKLLADEGAGEVLEAMDTFASRNAVEHLFQVACGLHSMVVGESEVVGQVRSALSNANQQASPALHRLFQMALATSKLISASTNLGALGRSVASVALDLVESRHGSLSGRPALLIGTGSYAGVVTADLVRRGSEVSVYSSSGRAAAFARTHPVTPLDSRKLPTALARAGAVVACSGTGVQTLTASQVAEARVGVFGLLPVVDLALGRDVDPELAITPGIDLIDLDVVGAHSSREQTDSLIRAQELVSQAVESYLGAERGRLADPAVTAMRAHVNDIINRELDSVAAQASPEVTAAVTRSLRRVGNSLLHTPSLRAAELARNGELDDYAHALETLFGIEISK